MIQLRCQYYGQVAKLRKRGGRNKGQSQELFLCMACPNSKKNYFSIPRDFKNASLLGGRPRNFVKWSVML